MKQRQEPSWNAWEIMMLIVVPNIVTEEITPFAIVRICFLARDKLVVLGNEMT
jgi:hypothetical protein